jgi:hypothetical protein
MLAPYVNGILIGYLVLVVALFFTRIPIHWGILAAFVLGLLFLPMVSDTVDGTSDAPGALAIPGIALSKYKVLSLAVLLGVLLRDPGRVLRFRPGWVDLPMIMWCLCPLPSALMAPPPPDGSTPFKDGLVQTVGQCLLWGVPYFMGRLYFATHRRILDLCVGVIAGALLYVPLCLFEVRMSPQLHAVLYGFTQHSFEQTIRFSGFRPMVFMEHGLALSLFMALASLLGAALWWCGALQAVSRSLKMPSVFATLAILVLAGTSLLLKSTGALLLATTGLGVFLITRWVKLPVAFILLLAIPPGYLALRTTGSWAGNDLTEWIKENIDSDRAESFECRLINEDLLMERAWERPVLGWCGWGRNLVHDADGRNTTIPDGLWIITLGNRGLVGLLALYAAMLVPVIRFLWLHPARIWFHPLVAPAAACALTVTLFMIDNLMNAMFNHLFVLMAGALAAVQGVIIAPRMTPGTFTRRSISPSNPTHRFPGSPAPCASERTRP